jgi:Yip1 domain
MRCRGSTPLSSRPPERQGRFGAILVGLLAGAISFLVVVFAINLLAGIFQGKPNFSRTFAAISLAAIPAWLAGIVGAVVPWAGPLITLSGAIVTLVFVYKIMPLALEVPDGKRILHFVVSIVVVIVINLATGGTLHVGRTVSGNAALP